LPRDVPLGKDDNVCTTFFRGEPKKCKNQCDFDQLQILTLHISRTNKDIENQKPKQTWSSIRFLPR